MATAYILPNIGSTGSVTLLDPFAGLVSPNVPYKVTAVATLFDITSNGQDPYALYYEPNQIPESKFIQDVADGVCIISLTSISGTVVRVPNSYLKTLPVSTGMPYASMMVGVNLGALPTDLSLSYFNSRVQALAHDLLGIDNADVRSVKASDVTFVSLEDATSIEAARLAVMSVVVTDAAKLLVAQNTIQELTQRNAELEAYILANPATP